MSFIYFVLGGCAYFYRVQPPITLQLANPPFYSRRNMKRRLYPTGQL